MKKLVTEAQTTSQSTLLNELADLLAHHPDGSSFRLMYAPEALELAKDEVLVQTIDETERAVTLRPYRLEDLTLDDTIHDTQVLNPSDDEYNQYVASMEAKNCTHRLNLKGKLVHVYPEK